LKGKSIGLNLPKKKKFKRKKKKKKGRAHDLKNQDASWGPRQGCN
jgi:hypothetical protein